MLARRSPETTHCQFFLRAWFGPTLPDRVARATQVGRHL